MADQLKTAEEFREHAAELRAKANTYRGELRAMVLEIATHYDVLAESVLAIERSSKKLLDPPKT